MFTTMAYICLCVRCISAGISDRHLLQRRYQHPLLLGSDADGRVRHSVADAVHHGDYSDRVAQCRMQHLRRHGRTD